METTEARPTVQARMEALCTAVRAALGGGYTLKGCGTHEYHSTLILEGDGSPVCDLTLHLNGGTPASPLMVAVVRMRALGDGSGWRTFHAKWIAGAWTLNATLFHQRVDEERDAARGGRAANAQATQAQARARAWLEATEAWFRPLLDPRDRVGMDPYCGGSLTLTLNAKDDPNPAEAPTGDTLTIRFSWDEHGKANAIKFETGHTVGAGWINFPTFDRVRQYLQHVQVRVETVPV